MITVYRYMGRFGDDRLPADYLPCLIGMDDKGDEAYFETIREVEAGDIDAASPSGWVSHPVRIVAVRFLAEGRLQLGYATADELLTAGVDF